jgi:hypothetical protein
MKFFIIENSQGEVIDCAYSLKDAKVKAAVHDLRKWSVSEIDCRVNKETVRRLIGGLGGYSCGDTKWRNFDGLTEVQYERPIL